MPDRPASVLVIGYGNPGRLDDGLGPALIEALERQGPPPAGVTLDSNYQLNVEDASAAAEFDRLLLVDAAVSGDEPFSYQEIEPRYDVGFSSHSVGPETVLGLAHKLFGAETRGFVLGIRGYEFNEFGQRLSAGARANLDAALEFVQNLLQPDSQFRTAAPADASAGAEPSGDGEAT